MALMDEDNLVASLTAEGPKFEVNWMEFLFNVPKALQLKEKDKESVLQVLAAGQRYTGSGWTTGRASRTLYESSGVAIVKASIDSYRDVWLYAVALITGVDLPVIKLAREVAEAAFALIHYLEEEPQAEAQVQEVETDEDSDTMQFPWDEATTPLPKALAALWARSTDPEQRVQICPLLEA